MGEHKKAQVPALERDNRPVVLLTRREAAALFEFMSDNRLQLTGKHVSEDLARTYRVLAKQLDWIKTRQPHG